MASDSSSLALFLFIFFFLSLHPFAGAGVVIEDGYTVKTVIDGHKLGINPYSVMLRPGSSDLVVLDYTRNAFYTVPLAISKDIVAKRISGSGTGEGGYSDGEPETALFSKPRNFVMDLSGNIYVADKNNNVIRKITDTGVSTIAGVFNKTGKDDGPVQIAKFSNDFELVFVAEKCALLVSDHGNSLVRQISLKAEDCVRDSGSGHGVGSVSVWGVAVAVVVACIVGFGVGFVARPYIFSHEGTRMQCFTETWKLCPIHLGKQVQIPCFVIRSAVANSLLIFSFSERLFWLILSHLSLIFRTDYQVPQVSPKERASLLDNDKVDSSSSSSSSSSEMIKSQKYVDQLKDLISFDGSLELTNTVSTQMFEQGEEYQEGGDVFSSDCCGNGRIDAMIKTNIKRFTGVAEETTLEGTLLGSSGLVKRR